MRSRILIKCIILVIAACGALALFAFRAPQHSIAQSDLILAEIAKYKTWTKVNQKPREGDPAATIAEEGG
jgi:hypothetical protein